MEGVGDNRQQQQKYKQQAKPKRHRYRKKQGHDKGVDDLSGSPRSPKKDEAEDESNYGTDARRDKGRNDPQGRGQINRRHDQNMGGNAMEKIQNELGKAVDQEAKGHKHNKVGAQGKMALEDSVRQGENCMTRNDTKVPLKADRNNELKPKQRKGRNRKTGSKDTSELHRDHNIYDNQKDMNAVGSGTSQTADSQAVNSKRSGKGRARGKKASLPEEQKAANRGENTVIDTAIRNTTDGLMTTLGGTGNRNLPPYAKSRNKDVGHGKHDRKGPGYGLNSPKSSTHSGDDHLTKRQEMPIDNMQKTPHLQTTKNQRRKGKKAPNTSDIDSSKSLPNFQEERSAVLGEGERTLERAKAKVTKGKPKTDKRGDFSGTGKGNGTKKRGGKDKDNKPIGDDLEDIGRKLGKMDLKNKANADSTKPPSVKKRNTPSQFSGPIIDDGFRPSKVLMVAEKPSLAESIVKYLSNNQYHTRKSMATPVHEYTGAFKGKNNVHFKVTSVTGHVYTLDFPKEYNQWDVIDPKDLFNAPTIKLESNPKSKITRHLQEEAKDVDCLVLWLDCDREGENICFEVIKNVQLRMKSVDHGSKKRQIFRAKFSSITKNDILKAMQNLSFPNENEAKAVDCRQELDLKIGCAFTRFQTRFFQGKYGNLDASVISYGPCQTPTLAFCVARHDEILSFVPKPFWTVQCVINHSTGRTTNLLCSVGRMFKKSSANALENRVKECGLAKVTKVTSEKKSKSRPHGLSTVELLKIASKGLGIGPSDTMHIAERLYIQGYISYPRTETSRYAEEFNLRETLASLQNNTSFGSYARELLQNGFERPQGGHDAGDHPPITPMYNAEEGELIGDAWRLYDYICRHFIGSLCPNMKYLQTTVTFDVDTIQFSCSGKQVIQPGWTSVMHWMEVDDEKIPDFAEGESYPLKESAVKSGETSPPGHLTESELLELMEKHGIGTDASMATFVNLICVRNYVQLQHTSRVLVPTNLGIVLIHGYQKIDKELCLPTIRSEMEKQISLIASGEEDVDEVNKRMTAVFLHKFVNFTERVEQMDQLFEATYSTVSESGKPFSKCGVCRRYMHLLSLRPPRLHCRNCNETYNLPANGNIKLYRELKCPLDNFELVLFSTGSKGKGYPLCPQCYNTPPFENVLPGMGCNKCVENSCPYSMARNAIMECPEEECKDGSLVLDDTSAPRWKLTCNQCNLVARFSDKIHRVTRTEDICECGCLLIKFEFREREQMKPITGCVMCGEEMQPFIDTKMVKTGRFFRGRGRGRGRRRGRGRGRRYVDGRPPWDDGP